MLHILDILAVREAVAAQPGRRREICELLMQGFTREEVAAELGCQVTTVHSHIARIRRSFVAMGFSYVPRWRRVTRRAAPAAGQAGTGAASDRGSLPAAE